MAATLDEAEHLMTAEKGCVRTTKETCRRGDRRRGTRQWYGVDDWRDSSGEMFGPHGHICGYVEEKKRCKEGQTAGRRKKARICQRSEGPRYAKI